LILIALNVKIKIKFSALVSTFLILVACLLKVSQIASLRFCITLKTYRHSGFNQKLSPKIE
jgi:hypothetical protein